MIVYVHGFRSSGESTKALVLCQHFGEDVIERPDLPISPENAVSLLENLVASAPERVLLVGSSLGGFYSLYLASKFPLTAALLNPSLAPWRTLAQSIGTHEKIHSDEAFEWKTLYNEALAGFGKEIEKAKPFSPRLHFFLSEDDELLDHSGVPNRFPEAATIEYYSDCGHRFTRFEELIPKLKAIYGGLECVAS